MTRDARHICDNCKWFDKASKYYGYCENGWRSLRAPNETCDGGGKGNDGIGFSRKDTL